MLMNISKRDFSFVLLFSIGLSHRTITFLIAFFPKRKPFNRFFFSLFSLFMYMHSNSFSTPFVPRLWKPLGSSSHAKNLLFTSSRFVAPSMSKIVSWANFSRRAQNAGLLLSSIICVSKSAFISFCLVCF